MDTPPNTQVDKDSIYNPLDVDFVRLSSQESAWKSFAVSFGALPASVRSILGTSPTKMFLKYIIAQSYNLSPEQSAGLSRIIRNVLMGVMFIGDMTTDIMNRLKLDQATAQEIRDQVIKELFAPALEDIKALQRKKFASRFEKQTSSPATPPIPQPVQPQQEGSTGNVVDLRK